jgi:hypothetical protein
MNNQEYAKLLVAANKIAVKLKDLPKQTIKTEYGILSFRSNFFRAGQQKK